MEQIAIGPDMIDAFNRDVESYTPTFLGRGMAIEGGISASSYSNLKNLLEKLGRPYRIDRRANGNVLVYFANDKYYLATGFDCGYQGTGPYYFSKFLEETGLDPQLVRGKMALMPRDYSGIVWQQT